MNDFIINPHRFGAFSPDDLSPSAWYEADSLGLANGAAVATWTDLSANAKHATQGTAANRPLYVTGAKNGHAAVDFDGTNDFLATSIGTVLTSPTDRSFAAFAVVRPDVLTSTRMIASQQQGAGDTSGPQFLRTNATTFQTGSQQNGGAFDSATGALATGTWYVVEGFETGSLVTALVNGGGGAGTASAPTQNYNNGLYLGALYAGTSLFWNGLIAEIIIYPSDLTSGDRTDVRDYLTDKYAI